MGDTIPDKLEKLYTALATINPVDRKLYTALATINPVDSYLENTNRAVDLLEEALKLSGQCSKQEEFSRVQNHLHECDPKLDLQAIRQLFKEADGILSRKNDTPDRISVLQTLIQRIDTLDERLVTARKVYAQLPDLLAEDLKDSARSVGIRAGLISPAGDMLTENAGEFISSMIEKMAPTSANAQRLKALAVVSQATLIILTTAVVPIKMAAESQLKKLSARGGSPDNQQVR